MFSKIKSLIVVFASVVLSACGGGQAPSDVFEAVLAQSKSSMFSYEKTTVEVLGDSISIGLNVEVSPIMRLGEYRPNWVVEHRSAGGLQLDTMIAGYSEPWPGASPMYFPMGPQPPFIQIERKSHFVVVALGLNDAIHNTTLQEAQRYEDNLRYVVRNLLAENRVPVLTGVPNIAKNPLFRDHYNNVTHKIAQEFDLVHAGWGEAYGEEGVGSDTIHPHQGGSDALAGRLIVALDRAIERDRYGGFRAQQLAALR